MSKLCLLFVVVAAFSFATGVAADATGTSEGSFTTGDDGNNARAKVEADWDDGTVCGDGFCSDDQSPCGANGECTSNICVGLGDNVMVAGGAPADGNIVTVAFIVLDSGGTLDSNLSFKVTITYTSATQQFQVIVEISGSVVINNTVSAGGNVNVPIKTPTGPGPGPAPSAVPGLGEWGAIVVGIGLAILGVFLIMRRSP